MDEFQATSSAELKELRTRSAEIFADLMLAEAALVLLKRGGDEALEDLRTRLSRRIEEVPDHTRQDDRPARIAFEELERVIQLARDSATSLRGWTDEGRPTVEEQKP